MRECLRSLRYRIHYSFNLHDKTLYSRYIFQFSSLRVVTNLAIEHRINEAKLIRLCHTLDKNKKKKKDIHDKIHKLLQASSVLDKTTGPVQVCMEFSVAFFLIKAYRKETVYIFTTLNAFLQPEGKFRSQHIDCLSRPTGAHRAR